MDKLLLEELGLTRNESLAYESLLIEGETTPVNLAKRIAVTRENSYYILNSLIEKRLVEKKDKGKKYYYRALSPERINELLEQEKQRFHEKEKAISAIIPRLNNFYSMRSDKPSIAYFEGIRGIKQLYKDALTLDKPGEMLVFRSPKDEEVLSLDWIKGHIKEQTLAGIKTRLISPKSAGEIFTQVGGLAIKREVKYSDERLNLPAEICVIKDRVSIVPYKKDKLSALIISKDFADSVRQIFDYVWDSLE